MNESGEMFLCYMRPLQVGRVAIECSKAKRTPDGGFVKDSATSQTMAIVPTMEDGEKKLKRFGFPHGGYNNNIISGHYNTGTSQI